MTPVERVKAILNHEKPDYVPFTIYESKVVGLPYGDELMAMDICMLRRIASYGMSSFEQSYESKNEALPNGHTLCSTVIHTPKGDLSYKDELTEMTTWHSEYMFKDENDYDKLIWHYSHMDVYPIHEERRADFLEDAKNEKVFVRDNVPHEPYQDIIDMIMGPETFCYEWMDNRERMLELLEIMRALYRKTFPIAAESPFKLIGQGGNATPEIIGRQGFRDFYMYEHAEAAQHLHAAGKLLSSHFDACNGPIMDLIAEDAVDMVEAYDAAMSPGVKEATECFGDKILSLHFPSAWQMHDEEQIVKDTIGLIEAAKDPSRLIIGTTEDMPFDRYVPVVRGILKGIREYGRIS